MIWQLLEVRDGKRGNGKLVFPLNVQHRPAGDHHVELGTAGKQLCHLDGSPDHLLKVVQQEQELPLLQ